MIGQLCVIGFINQENHHDVLVLEAVTLAVISFCLRGNRVTPNSTGRVKYTLPFKGHYLRQSYPIQTRLKYVLNSIAWSQNTVQKSNFDSSSSDTFYCCLTVLRLRCSVIYLRQFTNFQGQLYNPALDCCTRSKAACEIMIIKQAKSHSLFEDDFHLDIEPKINC